MSSTQQRLLEQLESAGVGSVSNISPFMRSNFQSPTVGVWGWEPTSPSIIPPAHKFLIDMKEAGYIDYKDDDLNFVAHAERTGITHTDDFEEQWFTRELLVRLRIGGLDYLNQLRLINSNLSLNESTKRNSETQRKYSLTTIYVAVAAAIGSFASVGVSIYDRLQSKSQVELLKKEITSLQLEQMRLQNLLTYVQDSSHKHRPSFSSTESSTLAENKNGSPKKAK